MDELLRTKTCDSGGRAIATDLLGEQDWNAVEAQYEAGAPHCHAVVDDFLLPEACSLIRRRIAGNKGWSFLNVNGADRMLQIRNFDLPAVKTIARALIGKLPRVLGGLSLVEYRAFMNWRSDAFNVHADNALVTVNVYLTQDEFNREPETGGLVLFDVRRGEDQAVHEFNAHPWAADYCERNTRGGTVRIGYRCNRAVLFDARTFHSIDRVRFVGGDARRNRINLALRFDRPEEYDKRNERYAS